MGFLKVTLVFYHAVTQYQQSSGLKQHEFVILQFCTSGI